MQRQPESDDHEHEVHDPEAHDGLFFGPAGELEVVMERSHLEDLAAEEVARDNLDDDGERLDIEHEAEEEKGADLADGHGVHCKKRAEAEGADVSHHEARGFD